MLSIAYISSNEPKPKKLTQKERIHLLAIASLAERREHDRQKAIKMFAGELEELEHLERLAEG